MTRQTSGLGENYPLWEQMGAGPSGGREWLGSSRRGSRSSSEGEGLPIPLSPCLLTVNGGHRMEGGWLTVVSSGRIGVLFSSEKRRRKSPHPYCWDLQNGHKHRTFQVPGQDSLKESVGTHLPDSSGEKLGLWSAQSPFSPHLS